jgi:hypothetical protein
MSNEELLKQMKEKRESAYRVYREAELTEDAKGLAHMEGILDGMYEMIKLVEEYAENNKG